MQYESRESTASSGCGKYVGHSRAGSTNEFVGLHRGKRSKVVGKATSKDDIKPSKEVQPTPRQRQLIQLLAEGKVNKEIAAALKISVRTAETHRATIMPKVHFRSFADLVLYAKREVIVSTHRFDPKARAAKNG